MGVNALGRSIAISRVSKIVNTDEESYRLLCGEDVSRVASVTEICLTKLSISERRTVVRVASD